MTADLTMRLALADKSKPLRIRAFRGEETTCFCGAAIYGGEWVVTLPEKLGNAHTHCASDAGFALR